MTNTQKLLIGAVIILGVLVAITIPPSLEFYFEKKNHHIKPINPRPATLTKISSILIFHRLSTKSI